MAVVGGGRGAEAPVRNAATRSPPARTHRPGTSKFSTDRTIEEYAREIWRIVPCRRSEPVTDAMGRARSFPNMLPGSLGAPDGLTTNK